MLYAQPQTRTSRNQHFGKAEFDFYLHKSTFETIIPLIAEDFNQIVYIWKQYDHAIMKELIEQQKPQIVIEEMVERSLILVRESNDMIAADPTAASIQH